MLNQYSTRQVWGSSRPRAKEFNRSSWRNSDMARWNPDADPTTGRFERSSEIRFVSDRRGRPIADVVLQWITSMMSRVSFPIFRLEDPRERNLRDLMGFVANSLPFGAETRRRTDSGIL